MNGALGGFNVGCQYQFGWWLIGIEGGLGRDQQRWPSFQ